MKLTRRKLASAVLLPAVAAAAPPPEAAVEEDPLVSSARARYRANFAAVAKVELPIATEPAFQFKA